MSEGIKATAESPFSGLPATGVELDRLGAQFNVLLRNALDDDTSYRQRIRFEVASGYKLGEQLQEIKNKREAKWHLPESEPVVTPGFLEDVRSGRRRSVQ